MKFLQCITLATVLGSLSSLTSASAINSKRSDGDGLLQYGYNPPRVNPDYCVGKTACYHNCSSTDWNIGVNCVIVLQVSESSALPSLDWLSKMVLFPNFSGKLMRISNTPLTSLPVSVS